MRRTGLFALAISLTYVSVGAAQQYPIMDKVADKVIAKYQSSSCQQLYQQKQQPPSPEVQHAIQLLKGDPQMRQAFINRVAAPIANKLFDCGLIP
jgi:hypothetical protein